jgi:hypothetical protein
MMIDRTEPRHAAIRFLLGEMSAEERERFEDQSINDDDLFQSVAETENDLIDLYAMGALSQSEQERLERSFLADPERRERLPFARALVALPPRETSTSVREPSLSQNPPLIRLRWTRLAQPLAAAVLLGMVVGMSWLLFANHSLKVELQAAHQQQATAVQEAAGLRQQIDALTSELNTAGQHVSSGQDSVGQDSVSFTLSADASRGSGWTARLALPSTAAFAVLRLVFPADTFSSYHVFAETAAGKQVWQQEQAGSARIGAHNKEIVIAVPVEILKPGDYVLRVTAGNGHETEDVTAYSFRVVRR